MHRELKNLRAIGAFSTSNGQEQVGELLLDGSNSRLELFSDSVLEAQDNQDVVGVLNDGRKVSLIDCISLGSTQRLIEPGKAKYIFRFFPHYAIFGATYLQSSDEVIRSVRFSVRDVHSIFHDFEVCDVVLDNKAVLDAISKNEQKSSALEKE